MNEDINPEFNNKRNLSTNEHYKSNFENHKININSPIFIIAILLVLIVEFFAMYLFYYDLNKKINNLNTSFSSVFGEYDDKDNYSNDYDEDYNYDESTDTDIDSDTTNSETTESSSAL